MNIGFAGFRHYHILGLYNSARKNPDVNIILCFEENQDVRQDLLREQGIDFNCDAFDKLIHSDSIDTVAIGDYYGRRGALVIEALKAGKNVIADKPICTSISELDEIERLSEEMGLKVGCMLDLRYLSQFNKARELIADGVIGEVQNVSFTAQHHLNYGVRPMWYFESGKHGGTINDIGIHGIDVIRYITGKNLSRVDYARVWNAYAKEQRDFCDCGQFVANLEGISVMADVSYAAPKYNGTLPTYWEFTFWGLDGMMRFNLESSSVTVYKTEKTVYTDEASKTPEECYYDILKDFCLEIQGHKTRLTTSECLKSQRQILEIQRVASMR